MNRLGQNRLTLQLLLTFIAALSLTALSVLFISEAIRSAERVVVGETNDTLASAIHELQGQYSYWTQNDSSWSSLPPRAQDLSLRALSQTVLRSYPGVEGGFYSGAQFLGYSFPTHDRGDEKTDVPVAEKSAIVALVQKAASAGHIVRSVVRGRLDILVLSATPGANGRVVAWAMKRLAGRGAPDANRRESLLAVLVLAALVSVAGIIATGLSLARGVTEINKGLSELEGNFEYRLPERSNEFGTISRSINRMSTARLRLETELRREDRLRALGRLSASLAHEIRNPLNSIRLTVQVLEHRMKTNSIRPEDLQTVRSEVDRLSALLNDLLDLQRIRQPIAELQPVLPAIEHCVSLVSRQAALGDIRIALQGPPQNHATAFFDTHQLTQAIVNLLLNAIEASSPGSTVKIRLLTHGEFARIEIQDEGAGVRNEQHERLFEPFFTTKTKGTGLGLAVSRELMRAQGGDVFYQSGAPGALFVIQLRRNKSATSNSFGS